MRFFKKKQKEPDMKPVHCYVCGWKGRVERNVVMMPCPDCGISLTISVMHEEYGRQFDKE